MMLTHDIRLEHLKNGALLINSGNLWGLRSQKDTEWDMGYEAANKLIEAAGGIDSFSKEIVFNSTIYRLKNIK